MNRLEKSIKKLQKKLDKRRKKLNKLAQAQLLSSVGSSEVKKINTSAQTLMKKGKVKKCKKPLLIGGLCVIGCVLVVSAVRKMTTCHCGCHHHYHEDGIPEDSMMLEVNNDINQASLEELENALLRVENELNEVNAAIEKRKN